ncbi:hypothetical protein HKX48_003385 [Thoreauomyces humboldtii]|nr:hypothetical protein HKX48_003385 [Thoreauomyces humboldtii]
MPKATWSGAVLAESDKFEMVENNVYFPFSSINTSLFTKTAKQTSCPWKGTCSYYTATVDGKENADCAWVYEDPKPAAANIKGHVAFWKGVTVTK